MAPLVSPLGPGREFDRIRAIAARLGDSAAGLGDDCALVPPSGETLVLSTDMAVQDIHFRLEWISFEEIGWRAAMAALSDLGAAGARCHGLLAAVCAPHDAPEAQLVDLMGGVGDAVRAVGGVILGGDLTAAPQWSIACTVVGFASRPVGRRGAQPGDGLWVTGMLGGSRAALTTWNRGGAPALAAREAFARPVARLAAGQWLALHGATAMMDISDGLGGDARHLVTASGVAADIHLEDLPVHPAVTEAAAKVGEAPAAFAATGGEDYELLVTLPPAFTAADAVRCEAACGVPLRRIGTVREGSGLRFLLSGEPVPLSGFDHFA